MASGQLPRHVEALLSPSAYPHPVERVELIQTHISYVLLAGDYVYKVKKPVDLGFLDYSTLEKRRFYCEEEVRFNRRLCPDAYLGVVPITSEGASVAIVGRGTVGGNWQENFDQTDEGKIKNKVYVLPKRLDWSAPKVSTTDYDSPPVE